MVYVSAGVWGAEDLIVWFLMRTPSSRLWMTMITALMLIAAAYVDWKVTPWAQGKLINVLLGRIDHGDGDQGPGRMAGVIDDVAAMAVILSSFVIGCLSFLLMCVAVVVFATALLLL